MTAMEALRRAKEIYKELVGDNVVTEAGSEPGKVKAIVEIARLLMEHEDAAIKL
jgi:hypothetical protein